MKKFLIASGAALAALLLAGTASAAPVTAVDREKFGQQYQICHAVAPGRTSTMATNDHSPADKKLGLLWPQQNQDLFITSPNKLVPGSRMTVVVNDPTQSGAREAYLSSLKR